MLRPKSAIPPPDPFIAMAAKAQKKWVKYFHKKLIGRAKRSKSGKIHTRANEDRP